MEGSSWRVPPPTNGANPQQHQYQQHQYAQQQQPQAQLPPYSPRGNPPVDSWRNVARENNAANNNPAASPAAASYSRRDRSRSPRRRRSPDDRRRRSRSRDRYRKRSPDERAESASRGAALKRIFITQLPSEIQHEPLTMLFARQGFMPSEVKIYDKHDRGSVRSMGVVEFVDVASAKKWMEQNQCQLTIPDGRKVAAEYVQTSEEDCFKKRDWICAKCTETNYALRETCFRCNASKAENGTLEARGYADIDREEKPTDTLLVRDLPEGVTESSLMSVLQRVTQGQLRFIQVKLSEAREFAWVQMRNASDAEMLLNCFKKSPLQIHGSMVITTFSRRPLSVILAEPVVTERAKQPMVEEQIPMPMQPQGAAAPFGQYGAPPPSMAMTGMPPGMQQMMTPQGMMPQQFGMPPPSMQQQPGPHAAAGVHMNTSMPPPNYGQPPPSMGGMMQQQPQQMHPGMMQHMQQHQQQMGMMGGQQPAVTQHQQLLQSQMAAAASMGMMPNMGMPPPGMQQQAAATAAAYNMPPPHMQQQMQQAQTSESLLHAQLAAMAAQQAALQAEVERLASGAVAAPVAQPQQPEKLGHILTPVGLLQQFEPPNPQTFTPEPSSGYMYDGNTKLYYDPKTMYFYNNASGKWNYYDAHFKTYIAVDEREQVQQALHAGFGQNNGAAAAAATEEEKKEKTPAEIAKEMMKWAKKNEKAKVQMSLKPTVKPLETKSAFGSGIAAAAAAATADHHTGTATSAATPTTPTSGTGFGTEVTLKMLDRSKNPLAHLNSDSDEEESPPPTGSHHHHHQQPRHQERQPEPVKEEPKVKSAAEHREAMMATLIDRAGKQCLLCRRAFPSVEVLDKHISKSDLHKKNLEEKQVEWGKAYVASIMAATDGRGGDYGSVASTSAPASTASAGGSSSSYHSSSAAAAADSYKYRDRAKERRNIHGIDAITADPFGHSRDSGRGQPSVEALQRESDAAAARPLDSSNKGSKMLQKMGWTEGAGLGKNLQGIVAPIQAERRVEGTGLGLSGSKITHGMHASHQDKTRAALFARYQDDRS